MINNDREIELIWKSLDKAKQSYEQDMRYIWKSLGKDIQKINALQDKLTCRNIQITELVLAVSGLKARVTVLEKPPEAGDVVWVVTDKEYIGGGPKVFRNLDAARDYYASRKGRLVFEEEIK